MIRIRILLADDHPMVLDGVERILEDEFDIVEKVEDGRALVEACLLYTSPSPRDGLLSRMPSSA